MINKYFLAKMNIPAYLKKFLYNRYGYNEIEGIPPIIFKGNGKYLLDYRIDGASGGVGERTKNLLPSPEVKSQTVNGVTISRFENGIITIKGTPTAQMDVKFNFEESTFSAGSYIHLRNNFSTYNFAVSFRKDGINKIAPGLGTLNSIKQITEDITVNQMVILCNNNAVGTNYDITIQPSIELTNEDTSYEPYGYKVPVVVSGKNLLQNTATSQTVNGVTFTVNNDKSITCNGTATGTTAITINTIFSINSTKISGCPIGGSWSSFQLDLLDINTNNVDVIDTGNGAVIQNENSYRVRIRIASGYTCNNLTFYPMIRLATIEDDTYEPYHEPITTNIYLDKPIEENKSISLSDTNVNIPTIKGTNVLTVDTEVQPSKVLIKI